MTDNGDPNEMSDNGEITINIIRRNNLKIANASQKCSGTITRQREANNHLETAVLDYLIFCEKMEPYFNDMIIDEAQNHVLTKYVTTKGASKQVRSDHNILFANFLLQYNRRQPKIKRELFNFKNSENQLKFFQFTSETSKFSSCFENSDTIEEKSNKFFKTLDDAFHACFQKVRIKSKTTRIHPSEIQAELDRINLLKMSINSTNCHDQKNHAALLCWLY